MDFSSIFSPLLGQGAQAAMPLINQAMSAPSLPVQGQPSQGALANGGNALASSSSTPTPTAGAPPVGARAAQSATAQVLATLRPQTGLTAAGDQTAEGISPGAYSTRFQDPLTTALASVNNAKTNGSKFGSFVSGLSAGEAGQREAAAAGMSNWFNIQKLLTDQQHLNNADAVAAQTANLNASGQAFNQDLETKKLGLNTQESEADVKAKNLQIAMGSRQPAGPGFYQYDPNNPAAPPVYVSWAQVAKTGMPSIGTSAPGTGTPASMPQISGSPPGAPPPVAPPAGNTQPPVAPIPSSSIPQGAPQGPPSAGSGSVGAAPVVAPAAPQGASAKTRFVDVSDPPPIPPIPMTLDQFSGPGQKYEADNALKEVQAAKEAATQAQQTQLSLAQMKSQLPQLTGFLTPGFGLGARTAAARAANTVGETLNLGDIVDPSKVAASETLSGLSTTLAAEMAKQTASGRMSQYLFKQIQEAKPSGEKSMSGVPSMIAAVDAASQRDIDRANFLSNYSSSGYYPSTSAADQAFNELRPPQWYAARAVISTLPPDHPLANAPQAAVEHLFANPNLAPQFDERYGPGASKMVLGK